MRFDRPRGMRLAGVFEGFMQRFEQRQQTDPANLAQQASLIAALAESSPLESELLTKLSWHTQQPRPLNRDETEIDNHVGDGLFDVLRATKRSRTLGEFVERPQFDGAKRVDGTKRARRRGNQQTSGLWNRAGNDQ
jgi:hypothetical protein